MLILKEDKSHRVAFKICDSHLTCKIVSKCLNPREQFAAAEKLKMFPSLACCPINRQIP